MMKRTLALGLLLSTVLSVGCVSATDGAQMRSDIDQLKGEVSDLRNNTQDQLAATDQKLEQMTARLETLERTLDGLRQADADTGVQMEKVIAELQILRGEVEEARFQLAQTRNELGETRKSVDDIIARPPMEVQAAAGADSVAASKVAQIGGLDIPSDKQALYEFAKKFLDDQKYDESIAAFQLFTERYKDDQELADNAYFWLGEAHYGHAGVEKPGKERGTALKKAILAYQKVLEFPGSNKADGALLKIGLAFEQLGFFTEAQVFYEEILQKHPKSPLKAQAQKRIAALKGKGGKKPRKK